MRKETIKAMTYQVPVCELVCIVDGTSVICASTGTSESFDEQQMVDLNSLV